MVCWWFFVCFDILIVCVCAFEHLSCHVRPASKGIIVLSPPLPSFLFFRMTPRPLLPLLLSFTASFTSLFSPIRPCVCFGFLNHLLCPSVFQSSFKVASLLWRVCVFVPLPLRPSSPSGPCWSSVLPTWKDNSVSTTVFSPRFLVKSVFSQSFVAHLGLGSLQFTFSVLFLRQLQFCVRFLLEKC